LLLLNLSLASPAYFQLENRRFILLKAISDRVLGG
jgi:hypothetical protein